MDLNTKAQFGTHPLSDPAWKMMSQEPVYCLIISNGYFTASLLLPFPEGR